MCNKMSNSNDQTNGADDAIAYVSSTVTDSASSSSSSVSVSSVVKLNRKVIPVTVFSGFLGSGKSTIILQLMKQLQLDSYKVCWLKNEYGDINVDSRLAAEKKLAVKEMLNGCICCTQVGKLQESLQQLIDEYSPDRIIIETSGSSLPAPLARELLRLSAPEHGICMPIQLDAIICVVDAVNFQGYKDKSYTAKMQAKFTDMILINKHELVSSPQQLDRVLDDVFELNPDTPKIKTKNGFVDYRLIMNIDEKLFMQALEKEQQEQQQQAGSSSTAAHEKHSNTEVTVLDLKFPSSTPLEWTKWLELLSSLPNESFYRVKGVIYLTTSQPRTISEPVDEALRKSAAEAISTTCANRNDSSATHESDSIPALQQSTPHLLNAAFGRYDLCPITSEHLASTPAFTHISFMGESSVSGYQAFIRQKLSIQQLANAPIKVLQYDT